MYCLIINNFGFGSCIVFGFGFLSDFGFLVLSGSCIVFGFGFLSDFGFLVLSGSLLVTSGFRSNGNLLQFRLLL